MTSDSEGHPHVVQSEQLGLWAMGVPVPGAIGMQAADLRNFQADSTHRAMARTNLRENELEWGNYIMLKWQGACGPDRRCELETRRFKAPQVHVAGMIGGKLRPGSRVITTLRKHVQKPITGPK